MYARLPPGQTPTLGIGSPIDGREMFSRSNDKPSCVLYQALAIAVLESTTEQDLPAIAQNQTRRTLEAYLGSATFARKVWLALLTATEHASSLVDGRSAGLLTFDPRRASREARETRPRTV